MVCISNINNKYIAALESSYGTTPSPFTSLDFGQIQSISIDEEENMEKLGSINGGHTYDLFEDGLYWANVSISTRCTKASIPVLLKACMGTYADDGTDYTITSSTTTNSYSIKASYTTNDIVYINGFVVKDFEISAAKGETINITMNGIARKVTSTTESISPSANSDAIFKDLDASITVGGNSFVLNNFNISGNWNVTDDEGRGIESVSAGDRRLITCVLKHAFDVSGSYEAEVDDNGEFGYTESRSDAAIVFTVARGTDNTHVFTMSNTRSGSRSMELSTDNSKRVVGYNYEALDIGVTGDL